MTSRQALVREITKDLVKWFLKHRKPITRRSLKPILERYIDTQQGVNEMTDYLSSKAGGRAFHLALRTELKAQLGK